MSMPTDGQDFRNYMIGYIREHFGEMLGEHVHLLDRDDGIEVLSALAMSGQLGPNFR